MSSAQLLLWHVQAAWLLPFTSLRLKMVVDFEMAGMLGGKAALCLATLFPALNAVILMRPRDCCEMMQFALPL